MRCSVFEQATTRAESYVGDKEKLLHLHETAARKSDRYYEFLLAPWESLQTLLRILRAQLAGKFCSPADCILLLTGAVIYFVSPFDLIPDSVPVLGLVDDASVIACVARANRTLISKFRNWETRLENASNPMSNCPTKPDRARPLLTRKLPTRDC